MKKTITILALVSLGMASVNAGVHVGFNFGIPFPVPVVTEPIPVVTAPLPVALPPPPMPAPVVEVAPACPARGYVWLGGSWGWADNHWVWTRGHWGPPVHWDRDYRAYHHESFRDGFHGGHGRR